jgi:tetratricopeptide (TPR) repeat protein
LAITPQLYRQIKRVLFLFVLVLTASIQIIYAQKGNPKLTEEQRIKFDQHFINANKFLMVKQPDEALKEIKQAEAIDAENGALNYLAAQIYLQKSLLVDAERYALKASKLEPENPWYNKLLGEVYKSQKQYKKAGELYSVIYRKEPKSLTALYDATYMYVMARELDKALKLLTQAEKVIGLNEDIVKQKQSIFLAQNKVDKAIKEAEKLTAAYPQNTRYIGQLADIYLSNGKEEKANELYRKILNIEPDNGYALLALADDYRNKKNYTEWFNYTLAAAKSPTLDVKSKLRTCIEVISSNQFGDEQKSKNYQLANALTQTNADEAAAWMLLGDLYAQDTKYKEAHEQYEKAAVIEPGNYSIWRQMAMCSSELRDNQQMMKDCERAIELFPNEALFYAYYTFAAQQLKLYQSAIDMARRGLELSDGQSAIQTQLYVSIGDAAHFLKQYSTSDSAFEAALKIDRNNTYALNNYAYFLSLRKTNLERAAEMSLRTIELDAQNASYYDTYGWILFVQKKYSEAKTQIEKSIELAPKNAEVLDHYGDVLYHLGDISKAIEQWIKARDFGVENSLINKKIKDKKWYE